MALKKGVRIELTISKKVLDLMQQSKEDFVSVFNKFDEAASRKLLYQVLCEVKNSTANGYVGNLRSLTQLLDHMNQEKPKNWIKDYVHTDVEYPFRDTNIVIFACKHGNPNILESIFDKKCNLLRHLDTEAGNGVPNPFEEDNENHDAFYYAVKAKRRRLLEIMIEKWPGNYFSRYPANLAILLSRACSTVNMRNVFLAKDVYNYVNEKLYELYHSFDGSIREEHATLENIEKRFDFLLDNFKMLQDRPPHNLTDGKFLYVVKYIAVSVHVLKQYLKSTYDRVPWTEIEFCLSTFFSAHTNKHENAVFCLALFSKSRLMQHLTVFRKTLIDVRRDLCSITDFENQEIPDLERSCVVANIILRYPLARDLYEDYEKLRDIYSLDKVSNLAKIAKNADYQTVEGQLAIIRMFQIVGQSLSSTLERPNLSQDLRDVIYYCIAPDIRRIWQKNVYVLPSYYTNEMVDKERVATMVQSSKLRREIINIGEIIAELKYDRKVQILTMVRDRIRNEEGLEEAKRFSESMDGIHFVSTDTDPSDNERQRQIYDLIRRAEGLIRDKTEFERELIFNVDTVMSPLNDEREYLLRFRGNSYCVCFRVLTGLSKRILNDYTHGQSVVYFRELCDVSFNFVLPKMDQEECSCAAEQMVKLLRSAAPRLMGEEVTINKLYGIVLKILYFSDRYDLTKTHFMVSLKEKIDKMDDDFRRSVLCRRDVTDTETNIIYVNNEIIPNKIVSICESQMDLIPDEPSTSKLPDIKQTQKTNLNKLEKSLSKLNISKSEPCNTVLLKNATRFKRKTGLLREILSNAGVAKFSLNDTIAAIQGQGLLQLSVEILVLQLLGILQESGRLSDNFFAMYDNYLMLVGRSLLDYLINGDPITDIIFSDPFMGTVYTARLLVKEDPIEENKIFGGSGSLHKFIMIQREFEVGYQSIFIQDWFHKMIEKGVVSCMLDCVSKGAELNCVNIQGQNIVHAAAQGPNLDIFVQLFSQVSSIVPDGKGRTPLHLASACGRLKTVEHLVNEKLCQVDDFDKTFKTPLHYAAMYGHVDVVRYLLKQNARAYLRDIICLTPISYAVRGMHPDVVRFLAVKEAHVDSNRIDGGCTLLHLAAVNNDVETAKLLLEYKADIDSKTDNDSTSLHLACRNNHTEMVEFLLEKEADVQCIDTEGNTALIFAVRAGNTRVTRLLLLHGSVTDVTEDESQMTPLLIACESGHTSIVRMILEQDPDTREDIAKGNDALQLASKNGHVDIVKILLKAGVGVNTYNCDGCSSLHLAAQHNHKTVVELLLEHKAKINVRQNLQKTPLHLAASYGHRDIVETLLSHGAKPNSVSINSVTPLLEATVRSHPETVEVLLKAGANVNVKDIKGSTPLHYASKIGKAAIVKTLLEHRANVNLKDFDGRTALHLAANLGNLEVVNTLLEKETQIDNRDNSGLSPLHLAVMGNHKEVLEALVRSGSDINASCKKYSTPLCMAVEFNYEDIVEVLIDNGADVNAKCGRPLISAVAFGYTNIVNRLLRCPNIDFDVKETPDTPLLFTAIENGTVCVVNTTLEQAVEKFTQLERVYDIPISGKTDIVQQLIRRGVGIDAKSVGGSTPLHSAVSANMASVVDVILSNGGDASIKDNDGLTPMDIAVEAAHRDVIAVFLKHKLIKVDDRYRNGMTLLHFATLNSSLESVKFLISRNAEPNVADQNGVCPIHMAAKSGNVEILRCLSNAGANFRICTNDKRTVLHCAVIGRNINAVKFLLEENGQKVDIQSKDRFGLTALHFAVKSKNPTADNRNCPAIVAVLLANGAEYNAPNDEGKVPYELATCKEILEKLGATDRLFRTIKRDKLTDIEKFIKEGGSVGAKNSDGLTLLHCAVIKNSTSMVETLLRNQNNPNIKDNEGNTPLHYAAMKSNYKMFKTLLGFGAIYEIENNEGLEVADLAIPKDFICLLKAIRSAFDKVRKDDLSVVDTLKQLKDFEVTKAIVNTRNLNNKSIIMLAARSESKMMESLKAVLLDNLNSHLNTAQLLMSQNQFQEAAELYRIVVEERMAIFGPESPLTVDAMMLLGTALDRFGKHDRALEIFTEQLRIRTDAYGEDNDETLEVNIAIGHTYCNKGMYQEALVQFQEVWKKQIRKQGYESPLAQSTQFFVSMCLEQLKRYDEALKLNYELYEKKKKTYGEFHPATLQLMSNIADIYITKGSPEEGLDVLTKLLKAYQRNVGLDHEQSIDTMERIAKIYVEMNHQEKAYEILEDVLKFRRKAFGDNNTETINTKYCMVNLLLTKGKLIAAQKMINEIYFHSESLFGRNHENVVQMRRCLEVIEDQFKINGHEKMLMKPEEYISETIASGDLTLLMTLLDYGIEVNGKDSHGKTLLHHAIVNDREVMVKILIANGSDVSVSTPAGDTSLHLAAVSGNAATIEYLIIEAKKKDTTKASEFIDARNTFTGMTALHLACEKNHRDAVRCLLKNGATYDVVNFNMKKPAEYASNKIIASLFGLMDELFASAKKGDQKVIGKVRQLDAEDLEAVFNAHNINKQTAIQVAFFNKNREIAGALLNILKNKMAKSNQQ